MEKVILDNIELAYNRRGRGTPLVLVHGFPLDHHIWDEVIPRLETSFDLIIPDLRGFGASTTINSPYGMDDFASDIAGLLDHLGIQKTAMAGHSMGGYIALAFARLFPDRLTALALVASQTTADSPDRKQGRYKSAAEVAEKGISGIVDTMTPKFTSDERLQIAARNLMERQQPAAYIGALNAMAERQDSTPLLGSMKYPVVVIHGEADTLIPIERAREVKAALPQAEVFEISGVGHLPMLEAVDRTVQGLKYLSK